AAGGRSAAAFRRSAVLAAAAAARLAGRLRSGGPARASSGPAPRAMAQGPLRTRPCPGPCLPRFDGRLDPGLQGRRSGGGTVFAGRKPARSRRPPRLGPGDGVRLAGRLAQGVRRPAQKPPAQRAPAANLTGKNDGYPRRSSSSTTATPSSLLDLVTSPAAARTSAGALATATDRPA